MNKLLSLLAILYMAAPLSAQIDMTDSTAQVIAYWNLNDEQNYQVTRTSNLTQDEKTLSSEKTNYEVNLKVVDATPVQYIVQWTNSNFTQTSKDELANDLERLTEDFPISVLTNEYGSDISILNWEDLSAHVDRKIADLKIKYKDYPGTLPKIQKAQRKHMTKESIEQNGVKDIQQFFAYHGAKYKLGETLKAKIKIPNNYGGDPLDADAVLIMDELLPENNTFVIKSFQNIDPVQLKAVTYDYLSKINIDGNPLPAYEDFPTITKQIWGGTEIHAPTGWPIFSQESEQVNSGFEVTLNERVIELMR